MLDRRRWKGAALAALLTTGAIFVMFDVLQHISWPLPLLEINLLSGPWGAP